ncbi:Putative glutathione import ATP-binding protein, GsiA-like [Desulfonema limicola]|uniref:Glutathione import ATP-binding protein, GsiA-like n=1 Tax=Desulfonema limicola TaxID=45656 RepID=A0A975GHT0_9BACT|nr:ABC transporter ATP-binding protein [Desulfonema limicola]QTA81777.1 Putative glutathione import ATP-binding protein, GsiA-like [Desulfonema limicola]
MSNQNNILQIKNLVTGFETETGIVRAVDDVSFSVPKGKTLGIVGESGCGKSVTALSIMRLLPRPAGNIKSGQIIFENTDITKITPGQMSKIRGNRISMIFQEPMTALNPVHRIGSQIGEVFQLHFPGMKNSDIRENSLEMLKKVGIPEPEQRLKEYPHQISGGMRQRVMIALALACKPDILIADEPTTALDVTTQAQILALIKELQQETGMSVIFITHDLGVIAEICDLVVVMYAGKIAETAAVERLFKNPAHPYTQGLLFSIPRLETPRKSILNIIKGMVPGLDELPQGCRFQNRCPHVQAVCNTLPPMKQMEKDHYSACFFTPEFKACNKYLSKNKEQADPETASRPQQIDTSSQALDNNKLLTVNCLKVYFPVRGGIFLRKTGNIHAVDNISFNIKQGGTLGLVGESGCGKTTVGRAIIRLYKPAEGQIIFQGKDIAALDKKELHAMRRNVQMIFQDPFESLNSRHTVGNILEEPFIIHKIGNPEERRAKVKNLLEKAGLSRSAADRYPHEFSGGQRQRIGIARAIALNPRLIICDEPVSALDVSIQSQILNLLLELQKDMGLTYLFISHDLTVVKHVSDHIAVMYLGKIVEYAEADTIYKNPLHPYTKALLSSIPVPEPNSKTQKQILTGDLPSPINPPSGCRFCTRCPVKMQICEKKEPLLSPDPKTSSQNHLAACHLVSN